MPIIAICGTPGTGKSELASRLADVGFTVIHLSDFVIKNSLYLGYDKSRNSYIIDEKKLIDRISRIAKKESKLVIEGIGAEILPPNLVDLCIVLTCEPFELERRLKNRGFSLKKIEENLDAERLGVILGEALSNFGDSKVIIIDTTYKSSKEIFDVIVNELRRRKLL